MRRQAKPAIDDAEQARKAADDVAAAQKFTEDQARIARRKLWPVSIFISRKTGRLYVRQGFEPVMEFSASLRDPDKPVGTHVFTAGSEGDALVWQAVSLEVSSKQVRGNATEPLSVLDRVSIPQEVSELIYEIRLVGHLSHHLR